MKMIQPLVDPVKNALLQGVRGYGPGWQGFALAAAATGLVAPAIFSNDDRGYGRTALITTPLITAGFAAAPGVWGGFREAYQDMRGMIRSNPFELDIDGLFKGGLIKDRTKSIIELRDAIETGALKPEQMRAAGGHLADLQHELSLNYYAAIVPGSAAKPPSVDRLADQSTQLLEALVKSDDLDPTQARYAWHEAMGKIATPSDRFLRNLGEAPWIPELDEMVNRQILEEGAKARAAEYNATRLFLQKEIAGAKGKFSEDQAREFLGTLHHRLGQMRTRHLEAEVPLPAVTPNRRVLSLRDKNVKADLAKARPEVAANLETAFEHDWISDANLVYLNGEAAGLELTQRGGAKTLNLGLVDPATRRTLLGDDFSRLGVARMVTEGDKAELLDAYVTSHLNPDQASARELRDMITSFGLHSGRNPDDSWAAEFLQGADADSALLSQAAMERRGQQVVFSPLRVYDGQKLEDLDHAARNSLIRKMEEAGFATKVGSESSLRNMVFDLAEAENYSFFQIPSMAQQDSGFRWMTKPLQLDPSTIPAHAQARVTTSAISAAYEGAVPQVTMFHTGITPEQVNLFGYLPDMQDGKLPDLMAPDVRAHALRSIESDMRSSAELSELSAVERRARAEQAWEALVAHFHDSPGAYGAARKLGVLGEGDRLVSARFASMKTLERAKERVQRLHVAAGMEFGPEQIIGFDGRGAAITSSASENVVDRVVPLPGGEADVYFTKRESMRTGMKSDVLGRKGLDTFLQAHEGDEISDVLNILHAKTGRGRPVAAHPEAFVNMIYFQAKIKDADAAEAVVQDANTLLTRMWSPQGIDRSFLEQHLSPEELKANRPRQLAEELVADLQAEHITYDRNALRLTEQSNPVLEDLGVRVKSRAAAEGLELDAMTARRMLDQERADRMRRVTSRVEQFFKDTQKMVQEPKSRTFLDHDSFFQRFRIQAAGGGVGDLHEYVHRYWRAGNAAYWDHTMRDMPGQVKTTVDFYGQLFNAGEHEVLNEVMSGLEMSHGDTRAAWEFAQHMQKGDFSQPLGNVVNMADIPGDFHFGTSTSHVANMFDPTMEKFQQNYSVLMDRDIRTAVNGKEFTVRKGEYLPVRGLGTYKAGVNEYGAGEYAAADYHKKVLGLLQVAGDENTDEGLVAKRFHDLLDQTAHDLFGKKGILRAEAVYPNAIAGAIRTTKSRRVMQPAYETASGTLERAVVNPFEIAISRNYLGQIKDAEIVEQLLAGKRVKAAGMRHPISFVPFFDVRLADEADSLGPNMIGVDEGVRSVIQSDDDKDILNLIFLKREDSIRRAEAAIDGYKSFDRMSNQWRATRSIQLLQGNLENTLTMPGDYMREVLSKKTLAQNISQVAADAKAGKRFERLEQRMATSATGAYSNLLQQLSMNLEAHPTLAADQVSKTSCTGRCGTSARCLSQPAKGRCRSAAIL